MLSAHTELIEKGEMLLQEGNSQDALRLFLHLVKRNPEDAVLRNRLGKVLVQLGMKEEAEKCFWIAMKTDPSDHAALVNLKGFWLTEGAYKASITSPSFPEKCVIGQAHPLPLSIENTGSRPWEIGPASPDGFSLGMVLADTAGNVVKEIGRSPIGRTVRPGERVMLDTCLTMIAPPGEYELKLDLLMNRITWFEPLGSIPTTTQFSLVEKETPITSFLIELTNICNFNCTFCPNEAMTRKRGMMEVATFRKTIADLRRMGFESPIGLHLMGEPLLHPRFFEFLDYAREQHIDIELHTNGMRLTDDVLDRIYGYENIVRFWISLHTPTEDMFLRIRRPVNANRENLYDSYLQSTKSAVRKKLTSGSTTDLRIYLMATPNSNALNVIDDDEQARSCLEEWYGFAEALEKELNIMYDREPVPDRILSKLPTKQLYPLFENTYIRFVPWHSWGGTFDRGCQRAPECRNPWFQFAVMWNGDCTTCCLDYDGDIGLGNIREHTIEEIWNGEKLNAIRRGFTKGEVVEERCRTCLFEPRG